MGGSTTQCDWAVLDTQRKSRDASEGFPEEPVLLASLVGKEKFCRLKMEEKTPGGARGFWEEHVVPAEAEGGHRHHRAGRAL